jgi:hypothetical protein
VNTLLVLEKILDDVDKMAKEGTKAGAMIALLKLQNRRATEVDARGLCGHLLFECLGSRKQDQSIREQYEEQYQRKSSSSSIDAPA